jgi:hypothetical protein
VLTVQGVASMTPVQVSQATASNLNATVVQATGSNLHTVLDSGTLTTLTTLTGTTTLTPGTGAANLGKAEDAAAASGDTGVMALAVQASSPADSAANGDYTPAQMSGGRIWTNDGYSTGAAVPAQASYNGANVGGNLTGVIGCGSSAIYDASTSGSTQLVALQSSQTIYICGYTIMASGTVNVNLRYGTGSNCATSPSNIVPAFQLTAQTGAVDGSAFYRGLKTAASNALCINTSGAVAVQAIVYYTQF